MCAPAPLALCWTAAQLMLGVWREADLVFSEGTFRMQCSICGRDGAQPEEPRFPERDAVTLSCPRCGSYSIDGLATGSTIERILGRDRFRLAYAIRAATDRREHLLVTAESAPLIAATAPSTSTLASGVDLLLLHLANKARRYSEQINLQPEFDFVRVPVRDESYYGDLVFMAAEMGFFDQATKRISAAGWQRIEALRAVNRDSRQAFVAMWFDSSLDDAWTRGFKPGIELSKYFSALRIDRKEHNNKIDDEIIAEIKRSGLLVADFTGHRGGVYFEAGLAHGLGIPVIWTCREDAIKDAHFDTRQYSHILWKTPEDLVEALDRRIRATVLPPGFGAPA